MPRIARLLIVALTALATLAATAPASADTNASPGRYPSLPKGGSVYSTPGTWTHNGRDWKVRCAPYSSNVTRCWTDIWATQVVMSGGTYRQVQTWAFNNLTYQPSPEKAWAANPLGRTGAWTAADGRRWRTECHTPATGGNACRSYVWSTVHEGYLNGAGARAFRTVQKWVFNNMVLFTGGQAQPAPTGLVARSLAQTCSGPTPSGYALTRDQRPYSPVAPYEDKTAFNTITTANFALTVNRSTTLSATQKRCWLTKTAAVLVTNSRTQAISGRTARFYPYQFEFSANPATKPLPKGWVSGLGQAATLSALAATLDLTGDAEWGTYAQQTYESFFVPIEQGGFASRQTGNLWFEEYPTSPPTTVLNGMNQASIGFAYWTNRTNDARGRALYPEIIASYKRFLPLFTVEDEAGTMSSYDLVRGSGARPLRIVAVSPGARLDSVTAAGATLRPGLAAQASPAPELLVNGGFAGTTGWGVLGVVSTSEGYLSYSPGGGQLRGVTQVVPAAKLNQPGRQLSLAMDLRRTESAAGGSVAPRITLSEKCGSNPRIVRSIRARATQWGRYHLEFRSPKAGCGLTLEIATTANTADGTRIDVDNVSLRYSDAVGANTFTPDWDHFVWRSPTSPMTLKGTGTVAVQAYDGGRWRQLASLELTPTGKTFVVPERLAGRNIHYGYHDAHPAELVQLSKLFEDPVFLSYARLWDAMALGYKVP